jgi:prepilin-type N-terminal cleavage/methylation domain-containing protein
MTRKPARVMKSNPTRLQGFSLVELMIAMVAGLIVSGAVVTFTLSSMKSNSDYVLSTRLTQELRNSMDLITRDLRRAGYDQDALKYLASGNSSPFTRVQLCNDSNTCSTPTTPAAPITCAIYAYDRANGTSGTMDLSNGEVRGVRLVQRTVNGRSVGVIEYAVSSGTTKPACDGGSPDYTTYPSTCNSTSLWCALSDPAKLDFVAYSDGTTTAAVPAFIVDNGTTVGTSPNQVLMRDLTVTLTGRLAGTTDFTRQMSSDVRIRSDCYNATISNCDLAPSP